MKFIRVLKAEENKYYFRDKCNDYEDGMEVQEITHWDESASNQYAIDDNYFNDKTIEIIPIQQALKMIGENEPKPKNIDYAAINHDLDILWLYANDDIHWFYIK